VARMMREAVMERRRRTPSGRADFPRVLLVVGGRLDIRGESKERLGVVHASRSERSVYPAGRADDLREADRTSRMSSSLYWMP
jgi:hypothetical protein